MARAFLKYFIGDVARVSHSCVIEDMFEINLKK